MGRIPSNLMSGCNILLLQGEDKQAKKEAIVTRTRTNKTEKVSLIHIIHVNHLIGYTCVNIGSCLLKL